MTVQDIMSQVGMTQEELKMLTTYDVTPRSEWDNSHLIVPKNPEYHLREGDVVIYLRPPTIDVMCIVTELIPKEEMSFLAGQKYQPFYRGVRVDDDVAIHFYRDAVRLVARDGEIPSDDWLKRFKSVKDSKEYTTQKCELLAIRAQIARELRWMQRGNV